MKRLLPVSLLFFIILCCFACEVNTEVKAKSPVFFDLNTYFDSQSEILEKISRIRKTTIVDTFYEEKVLDTFDFDIELQAFRNANINKIAWMDKYNVDSLFYASGVLKRINYHTNDEKLRTKSLSVSFDKNGQVDTINILNNTSDAIAELNQELEYIPDYGYSIKSIQKTILLDNHALVVDVKFGE